MDLELYVFFLCLIIFTVFVVLFTTVIIWIYKLTARGIKAGLDDEKIVKEFHLNEKKKKFEKVTSIISFTFSSFFCLIFILLFVFSMYINCCSFKKIESIPALKVVVSDSMSRKNDENKYLFENQLDNQIQTFDIVVIEKAPSMDELKLYDIVVYEINGDLVIHRIIGIEERNEKHPDERYFLLKGDAVSYTDKFPVTYDQIKGIYRGDKISFVGSFVMFLQSPSGILCIILIVFYLIGTPIIENKIKKVKRERIIALGLLKDSDKSDENSNEELSETLNVISNEESKVSDIVQVQNNETLEKGRIFNFDTKTFTEKLENGDELLHQRYYTIHDFLMTIVNIKCNRSKKHETYKVGRVSIAKFTIRGKTLNVYLGLNPADYNETKYNFIDVSTNPNYQLYPMRMKITSNRKVKWTKELISEIIKKYDFKVEEIVVDSTEESIPETKMFDFMVRSFTEKLEMADQLLLQRYNEIHDYLMTIPKIRCTRSKKYETYKVGRVSIVKLNIRGKTLNAYFGLNPNNYINSKYSFIDVSSKYSHQSYPMRMKITSTRKVKWTKELVLEILKKHNLKSEDE